MKNTVIFLYDDETCDVRLSERNVEGEIRYWLSDKSPRWRANERGLKDILVLPEEHLVSRMDVWEKIQNEEEQYQYQEQERQEKEQLARLQEKYGIQSK